MGNNLEIKSFLSNSRNYMLCGLVLIATGLSVSKPLISLGVIFLCFSWLIEGKIKEKFKRFCKNKTAIVLSSLYLISVIGLIHSSDLVYGLDDVRKKLSLFLIPFTVAGFSPLTKMELQFLLKVYLFWVVFSCLWSFCVYFGALDEVIVDKRDYSRYNSHIRFGLEVALAIFISLFFLKKAKTFEKKTLWVLICFFSLFTLYFFSFITGLFVFIITLFLLTFIFGIFTKKNKIRWLTILFSGTLLISMVLFISSEVDKFYQNQNSIPISEKEYTSLGNKYRKDERAMITKQKENGYLIERHISDKEFENAWNARSKINYNEKDLKGNQIKFTLRRFVTSKGLRKDKEGIDSLSDEEIRAIEKGVPNYLFMKMNRIRVRFYKIIWEYDIYKNGGNINGHSVLMRVEYAKAALSIIKNNLIFGVGTGDVPNAYNSYYKNSNSVLTKQYRLRGHNQYLTYGVTLGLVGIIWFLYVLVYPLIKTKAYKNYLYLAFFCIFCLSMITEDTLETQVGINFFVFFNTLLLYSFKPKNDD